MQQAFKRCKNLVYGVTSIAANLVVGHAAKLGVCPEGIIACFFVVISTFLNNGSAVNTISGINDFTLQSRPKIDSGREDKNDQDDEVREQFFPVEKRELMRS